MKTFIIINGDVSYIKKYDTLKNATRFAFNYCDHSKQVAVFELKEIYNYAKKIDMGITEM